MRYCALVIINLLFITHTCFAQDTIERKNRLTDDVIERFKVLKTAPETKVGPYRAFYRRRNIIAAGNYTKGVKTGIWYFYDENGKLSETFDYDKNDYIFEAPLDTSTNISFAFDAKIKQGDRVTRPLKVGGAYYGFIPYLSIFRLPFDLTDVNTRFFDATVELLVSPGGRLADYKVHLFSRAYQYKQTINMAVSLFSEEDKTFVPATLNHEPILARIFIKCAVNEDGSLDFF
ncbi:toxin-antitoxin system YwqK family antitoxin [Mucilaginibacter sp.]|uniref:toxin-antitoxin system YwqK family antitoxin n=1 Tax=Mucilaginibacter sp. TaxID=1882438 RepID=UPI003D0C2440